MNYIVIWSPQIRKWLITPEHADVGQITVDSFELVNVHLAGKANGEMVVEKATLQAGANELSFADANNATLGHVRFQHATQHVEVPPLGGRR